MDKISRITLTLVLAGLGLTACGTNPPEDPRFDSFGSGLPEQHNEDVVPPYPEQPFVPAQAKISDSDSDGVIDHRDQCDDHKEGVELDNQGCAKLVNSIRSIDLDVEFATGSAEIEKRYYPAIEELAKLHQQSSEFVVLIEGHTDNTGPRSKNIALSKQRAKAVANILISDFNVSKEQVLTTGLGPDEPIASNDTSEGRQKNRRMVAHLITRDRLLAKHYDIWTIDLGNAEEPKKALFEAM
jgi:outer membrane protein OmpA-like peptidoglycan-associated protein